MEGKLSGGVVIIEDEDRGRSKSRVKSKEGLTLTLEEAAFLLDKGRLKIKGLSMAAFFSRAIAIHPAFIVRYMVYSDLKERGYAVRPVRGGTGTGTGTDTDLWVYPRGASRGERPAQYLVHILRENDLLSFADLDRLLRSVRNMRKELILAVVDGESDITYYEVMDAASKLGGVQRGQEQEKEEEEVSAPPSPSCMITASLAEDRVLVHDEAGVARLHEEFYGKILTGGNRNHRQLVLSLLETAYLMRQNRMAVRSLADDSEMSYEQFLEYASEKERDFKDKLLVYTDLRAKGLVLKTGFKFGSHFRVYTSLHQKHSSYLVHVVPQGYLFQMYELARAVRLAHGVKKRMVIACVCVSGEVGGNGSGVRYIDIGRKKL